VRCHQDPPVVRPCPAVSSPTCSRTGAKPEAAREDDSRAVGLGAARPVREFLIRGHDRLPLGQGFGRVPGLIVVG
jgi:hypothetical protein